MKGEGDGHWRIEPSDKETVWRIDRDSKTGKEKEGTSEGRERGGRFKKKGLCDHVRTHVYCLSKKICLFVRVCAHMHARVHACMCVQRGRRRQGAGGEQMTVFLGFIIYAVKPLHFSIVDT